MADRGKFIDEDAEHWRFVGPEPEPDAEALLLAMLQIAELAGDDAEAAAALAALAELLGEPS